MWTLKKRNNDSSETTISIYQNTRRHIPQDCNLMPKETAVVYVHKACHTEICLGEVEETCLKYQSRRGLCRYMNPKPIKYEAGW